MKVDFDPQVSWRRTSHTYDVQIVSRDKWNRKQVRYYQVKRERSTYRNGEWTWSVWGGGNLRNTLCDENGATHKRCVNIVESWLILADPPQAA